MNFIAAVEILEAVVYGTVKKNTPCVTEYTNVMQCMRTKNNDACLTCILDSVAGLPGGNLTWPALIESNICSELAICASEICDPGCNQEWSTLRTCAEKWADEFGEEADICPGLGQAASAKKDSPILVQDFHLPLNYTNAGLENMQSY
jgi:hypothetical protein